MKRSSRRTPITRQYFTIVNQTLKLEIPGCNLPILMTLRDKWSDYMGAHAYFVGLSGYYNDYLFNFIPGLLEKERVRATILWQKKGGEYPGEGVWPYMPTIDDINDQLMRLYNEIDKRSGIQIPHIDTVIGSHIAQIAPDYIKVGCTIIKGKELTNLLAILKKMYFTKTGVVKRTKRKAINNPL